MASQEEFLRGGGEMGGRMRACDWAGSPLGPPSTWPQSLRSALSICLQSSFPTAIYWGDDLTLLYNDAWMAVPGERHPWALGRPAAEVWSDIWPIVGPQMAAVRASGEGFSTYDQMLPMMRDGRVQETYWNYSFTPIRGEDGRVAGIFNQGHEITDRVFGERRSRFLLELTDRLRGLSDPRRIIAAAQEALGNFLKASRVGYGIVDAAAGTITTQDNWVDDGAPTVHGTLPLPPFRSELFDALRSGGTVVIADVRKDARTSDPESSATLEALHIRAAITASLVKEGDLRAALYVHSRDPQAWTEREGELVSETAERTWSAVERATAEQRLHDSESRYRALATAGSHWVFRLSPDWQEMQQLNGHGELGGETASTRHWIERYVEPEHRATLIAAVRKAVEQREVFELEHPVLWPDGSAGWSHWRCVPVTDDRGEIVEWFGTATDVTERRRVQEALRASEARLAAVFEALPVGVTVSDAEGRLVLSNAQMRRFLPEGSMPARDPSHVRRWRGWDKDGNPLRPVDFPGPRAMRGEVVVPGVEMLYSAPDGRDYWTSVSTLPITDSGQRVVGLVSVIHDIDALKRSEEALRESEARLRELNDTLEQRIEQALADRKLFADIVEGTDASVQIVGLDYRLLAINKAAIDEHERLHGAKPRIGDIVYEMASVSAERTNDCRGMWSRVLSGENFSARREITYPNGESRFYEMRYNVLRDASGAQIGAYRFTHDVTNRVLAERRLEETEAALRHSQKMEAMGQLTGGVAHDFNNLLTPIVGSLDLLEQKGIGGEREQRLIRSAAQSAERARTLVQRLLAFARRQPLQPLPVDLSKLVTGMTELVTSTVGAKVALSFDLPEDLPAAQADPHQLEMALLNLAVNARDAMPDGGTLHIAIAAETIGRGHRSSLRPGRYIRLSVQDDGTGMDEETRARAIEPFFSTKGVGEGTGLGLSMAHGLASQLGGSLEIESRKGAGTRIDLWLPQSDVAAATTPVTERSPAVTPASPGRVLVVDDEPLVRMSTAEMLADRGYAVTEAASAEEALERLGERGGFDVLVTDHLMPGMNGTDLARRVREQYPKMAVLIVSGYADIEGIDPAFPRMAKPFRMSELLSRLDQLVEKRSDAAA